MIFKFKKIFIILKIMKTLVEKYRPNYINEVFLEEKNQTCINHFIEKKNFPNLLFYGPSGTGKTSTIIAMAREIYKDKCNLMVLELNASDNRNIQVVRKIIKEFASCKTLFNNGYKLIILDEVDSMTNDAQFCLRRIMETYCENVRFCFICNFVGKIIPAIQSRCSKFKFSNLKNDQISSRLDTIMKEEGIEINKDILDVIMNYCNEDMRKILNYIQLFKFHKCKDNTDDYFSLLRIPNLTYIEDFYKMIIELKQPNLKQKIDKLYEIFEIGIRKGYYDLETFCQSFYKILIKNYDNIDEKLFISLVERLSIIDKNPSKVNNYSAFIDNIAYLICS